MTATDKNTAARRQAPRTAARGSTGPGNEPHEVLEFTTDPDEAEEREVLFRVNGTGYTIPKQPAAAIALAGVEILARHNGSEIGMLLANREMFRLMLGDQGYEALLSVPKLSGADYRHLVEVCANRAMAALQGKDGSPN